MRRSTRIFILMILDIVLINSAIIFAYLLRFDFKLDITDVIIISIPSILIGASLIKIIIFTVFKLYTSLWRYASSHELISIVISVLIGNGLLVNYVYILDLSVPRSIYIIIFLLDIFFIGGIRFAYRSIRRFSKMPLMSKSERKRLLVVGAGDVTSIVIKELKLNHNLNFFPVAIVDNDKSKMNKKINGVSIIGMLKDIPDLVKKMKIDEVVVALDEQDSNNLNTIYNYCAEAKVVVKAAPTLSRVLNESFSVEKIREINIEDLLGREQVDLNNESIMEFIRNNIVLVTGGGGSIGSELCRQIARFEPKKILILDNYENNAFSISNELKENYSDIKIKCIIANIREKVRLKNIFCEEKPDIVFHAAAHKHVPLMEGNPVEAVKNNIFGTYNLAECANEYKVKNFVLISTDKAVNPTNIMGATKRTAELIVQGMNKISNTDFVAVRFGNVLGSNGSVIPTFKEQIKNGGPVTVTHRDVTRFFMTIPEAAQLVIQAGSFGKGGEIFVLDMGKAVRIIDLAKKMIRLSGFVPGKDIEIRITGLRPGEKLYEELLLNEEGLEKTSNDKIMIAQPVNFSFDELKNNLNILSKLMINNPDYLKEFMKIIVPSYTFEIVKKEKLLNGKVVKEKRLRYTKNEKVLKPEFV